MILLLLSILVILASIICVLLYSVCNRLYELCRIQDSILGRLDDMYGYGCSLDDEVYQ